MNLSTTNLYKKFKKIMIKQDKSLLKKKIIVKITEKLIDKSFTYAFIKIMTILTYFYYYLRQIFLSTCDKMFFFYDV